MRWKWSCTEGIKHGKKLQWQVGCFSVNSTDLTCMLRYLVLLPSERWMERQHLLLSLLFFSSWLHLVLDFSRVPVVWVSHVLVPWGLVSNEGLLLAVVGDGPGGVLVGGTPVTPSVSTRPASVVGRSCGVLVLPGRVLLVSSLVTAIPSQIC